MTSCSSTVRGRRRINGATTVLSPDALAVFLTFFEPPGIMAVLFFSSLLVEPIKLGIDEYSFIYSHTHTYTNMHVCIDMAGFNIYKKNAVHNVGRVVTLV